MILSKKQVMLWHSFDRDEIPEGRSFFGPSKIVYAERDIAGVLRECDVQERTKQLQNDEFEVPKPL